MISRTTAFQTEHGVFQSLEEAQAQELRPFFDLGKHLDAVSIEGITQSILANKEKIVDILTTTERSVGKARKIHGGRKPRKKKIQAPDAPDDDGAPL